MEGLGNPDLEGVAGDSVTKLPDYVTRYDRLIGSWQACASDNTLARESGRFAPTKTVCLDLSEFSNQMSGRALVNGSLRRGDVYEIASA